MTQSGVMLYLFDPNPADIDIHDIAGALSKICRFGGRSKEFYSVAEHCVHVSKHVSRRAALWGLLHDSAEAYLIDVPKPLQLMFSGYEKLEVKILHAVAKRFNLEQATIPSQVRSADDYLGVTEYWHMINKSYCDTGVDLSNVDQRFKFYYWPPQVAYRRFMDRFKELTSK